MSLLKITTGNKKVSKAQQFLEDNNVLENQGEIEITIIMSAIAQLIEVVEVMQLKIEALEAFIEEQYGIKIEIFMDPVDEEESAEQIDTTKRHNAYVVISDESGNENVTEPPL